MEPPPIEVAPQREVDQVFYVVRLTGHPSGGVAAVREGWVVVWEDLDVSLDQAAQIATAVAWNAEDKRYEPFTAEQRYTSYEWGASGFLVWFLVDVVDSAPADAVANWIEYAVGKMRGEKRPRWPWAPPAEGLGTAQISATNAVHNVFKEDYSDLAVDDASIVDESVRVRMHGANGAYLVVMTALQTGDLVCHVKRGD